MRGVGKRIWSKAGFPWYKGHAYPHLKNAGEGSVLKKVTQNIRQIVVHGCPKRISTVSHASPNAVIPAQLTIQNTKKVPLPYAFGLRLGPVRGVSKRDLKGERNQEMRKGEEEIGCPRWQSSAGWWVGGNVMGDDHVVGCILGEWGRRMRVGSRRWWWAIYAI